MDKNLGQWNISCLADGTFTTPSVWPVCAKSKNFVKLNIVYTFKSFFGAGINCSSPPPKPDAGTWEWDGSLSYQNKIKYTCGPYGKFCTDKTNCQKELYAECLWNKTWSPPILPNCAATACQDIPFPPREIGFVYSPDAKNNMTLISGISCLIRQLQ